MSISRKNWSALSSLARQWTMEDEEEVEREERRRRRGKSSSSTADPDAVPDAANGGIASGGDTRTSGSPAGTETSQGLSSEEQMQLDFVEMLRMRDEKRRLRHVETLRRQKQEEEEEGDGGVLRVEERVRGVVGGVARNKGEEEEDSVFPPVKTTHKQPQKTSASRNSSAVADVTDRQENGESRREESDPRPASSPVSSPVSRPARKFVSSVSISLDRSPSISGRTTPMSPFSPTAPVSPQEPCSSPCQSPPPGGAQSLVQNGHTQETGRNVSLSNGGTEQTSRPGLVRQSSRTVSFRMMRKKEEETSPLHRSASVRVATKKFETNTDQNEDEEKPSSFTRNSRQRISSRSIQEKMERLAQAAQKSETTRCADVSQRTLFLLEEVSRKRGIFEKDEQKETNPSSSSSSRQDFRSLRSGMSDRINRWINKSNQSGSAHGPTADLRHVDITSKRSLFENRGPHDGVGVSKTVNIYK